VLQATCHWPTQLVVNVVAMLASRAGSAAVKHTKDVEAGSQATQLQQVAIDQILEAKAVKVAASVVAVRAAAATNRRAAAVPHTGLPSRMCAAADSTGHAQTNEMGSQHCQGSRF
jgi:hypothetical protein